MNYKNCVFCNLDITKIENTILEETKHFIIKPSLGSFVPGYILIISKRHLNNMQELSNDAYEEYLELVEKYRNIFKKIYGKFPIAFEHGDTSNDFKSTTSIKHAHTHIINFHFKDETIILNQLHFKKFNRGFVKHSSYIYYLSPDNKEYFTKNFESKSQLMRIHIARDLNMENKYNWKEFPFKENILQTISDLKKYI